MHVGMWGSAVIVIAIVSWLMYRYLAPENWKEWSRAGVLQAFIIAFYAEMYGFPLTIYFLARFFGVDVEWGEGGNLWAQIFGTPMAHIVAMVIGYTIVFFGATLVADGWRRVHRARRGNRLVTEGVYSRMRHPQYTGLFLIVFGEGIVHWPSPLKKTDPVLLKRNDPGDAQSAVSAQGALFAEKVFGPKAKQRIGSSQISGHAVLDKNLEGERGGPAFLTQFALT
jgi:methanethiol S-methyltransferase